MDSASHRPLAPVAGQVANPGRQPRRAAIGRALAIVGEAIDRDRFARVDRRLMPDRLRRPAGLLELLHLSAGR